MAAPPLRKPCGRRGASSARPKKGYRGAKKASHRARTVFRSRPESIPTASGIHSDGVRNLFRRRPESFPAASGRERKTQEGEDRRSGGLCQRAAHGACGDAFAIIHAFCTFALQTPKETCAGIGTSTTIHYTCLRKKHPRCWRNPKDSLFSQRDFYTRIFALRHSKEAAAPQLRLGEQQRTTTERPDRVSEKTESYVRKHFRRHHRQRL